MTPPRPAAMPAAAVVAVGIAGSLIGLGLIAGREFLIVRDGFEGRQWLRNGVEWLGRISWHSWMLPASLVAAALGVMLLGVAVKPRARTHLPTAGEPVLWLRPTDIARASTAAALRVDGVVSAHSTASRRAVRIKADAAEAVSAQTIRAEVAEALRELAAPPRVKVTVHQEVPPQ